MELFSSVQSLSCVQLFETPWTAACQASLSITNSQSLLKLISIESVMPSNHLDLCHPLLLPSVFPSIRVFSNESVLCLRGSETLKKPEITCPAWLCCPSIAWVAGRLYLEVVPWGARGLDCFGLILNFPETPWAVLIELLFPCQSLIIRTGLSCFWRLYSALPVTILGWARADVLSWLQFHCLFITLFWLCAIDCNLWHVFNAFKSILVVTEWFGDGCSIGFREF